MPPKTIHRTKAYFDWSATRENYRELSESLENGIYVQSSGRKASNGAIQLFIGVYTADGKPIHEEYQDDVSANSADEAIASGLKRGQEIGRAHQA